jgi:V-type H+-transporting ATPase subunit C
MKMFSTTLLNRLCLPYQPETKAIKKTFNVLQTQFAYLRPRSNPTQNQQKRPQGGNDEYVGEYAALMDQEFFDFVLFEIPWIL